MTSRKLNQHSYFSTFVVGRHHFPGVWRYLLPPDFANWSLPAEQAADCSSCSMVAEGIYQTDCRCCTHLAQIPNFSLGLALLDDGSRDVARRLIDSGYTLPTGVDITPAFYQYAVNSYKEGGFGRDSALLCPMRSDQTGTCGVYPYRTTVCATFFCYHQDGTEGALFWEALGTLVQQAEIAAAQWSMGQVGIDPARYMALRDKLVGPAFASSDESDMRRWPKEVRRRLFGAWFGREDQFFEACARAVMGAKSELWAKICDQPLLEAPVYEEALEALVSGVEWPTLDLSELDDDESAFEDDTPDTLDALWTEVQASYRALPGDSAAGA